MKKREQPRRGPRLVYQQGDHICTLYKSPEEQLRAAIEYIRAGLERGERCLYVTCEHDRRSFRAALKRANIDVAAEEARGALQIFTKKQGHLKTGRFDPKEMIELLEAAVEDAVEAGFKGLCAAGDMVWLLDEAPGSERIAEYEAELNHFYRSHRALGLCLYRKDMPAKILDDCIATHRFVRVGGPLLLENPFYELPEIAAKRSPRAREGRRKVRHFDAAARMYAAKR